MNSSVGLLAPEHRPSSTLSRSAAAARYSRRTMASPRYGVQVIGEKPCSRDDVIPPSSVVSTMLTLLEVAKPGCLQPWHSWLHRFCRGLKRPLERLLAGLLETDDHSRWSYEAFFREALAVTAHPPVHVFALSTASLDRLYISSPSITSVYPSTTTTSATTTLEMCSLIDVCSGMFSCIICLHCVVFFSCLQCFDAVGWAAGRASGL